MIVAQHFACRPGAAVLTIAAQTNPLT